MEIRSKNEYKSHLAIIRFLENETSSGNEVFNRMKPVIDKMKREARKYANAPDDGSRVVKDYGIDGAILLQPLPESIHDYESAEMYFDDNMKYVCLPSMYDCTGQLFTSWYKLVNRNGRFYAYHSVCRDV